MDDLLPRSIQEAFTPTAKIHHRGFVFAVVFVAVALMPAAVTTC
jgi:hypothetical protein